MNSDVCLVEWPMLGFFTAGKDVMRGAHVVLEANPPRGPDEQHHLFERNAMISPNPTIRKGKEVKKKNYENVATFSGTRGIFIKSRDLKSFLI